MTDSKKPPPIPPRASTNRDVLTRKTPPAGIAAQTAAPDVMLEDPTGRYEGEELKEMRKKRPTDKRIEHLENKNDEQDKRHDALAAIVHATALTVAHIDGEMAGQNKLLDQILAETKASNQRQHARFMGILDVDTTKQKAEIEDSTDARKARRKLLYQLAGLVAGLLISSELFHWLIGKL